MRVQTTLVVDALAVARLTRLVTVDRAGRPARRLLLKRAYPYRPRRLRDLPSDDIETWAAIDPEPPALVELVRCPWCISVWIAAAVTAARSAAPRLWHPVATALACSQVAGLSATVTEAA